MNGFQKKAWTRKAKQYTVPAKSFQKIFQTHLKNVKEGNAEPQDSTARTQHQTQKTEEIQAMQQDHINPIENSASQVQTKFSSSEYNTVKRNRNAVTNHIAFREHTPRF